MNRLGWGLSLLGVLALLIAFAQWNKGGIVMVRHHSTDPAAASATSATKQTASPGEKWEPLTPGEARVIVACGTEAPFTGEFWNHHLPGAYACKRCGAPLFSSSTKFDSGTGWPSFDDCYPGALRTRTDPDGLRTEILCASCGGHMGHRFSGEGFTPRDTRHCVNSVALKFIPEAQLRVERALFAGGCFWGVEHHLRAVPGVWRAISGYTGGRLENPTYEEVCRGDTGHAETVEVVFDPVRVSYETLARLFLEIHDPTQLNRQGPDWGSQYRSAIFYTTTQQKETAERLLGLLREKGNRVVTQISEAGAFWPAEAHHQRYYERTGKAPYCHTRQNRF